MKTGNTFERSGRRYEVLQDGLTYSAKIKTTCLRSRGATQSLTIDQALKQQLIRELNQASTAPNKPTGDLLSLTYDKLANTPTSPEKTTVREPPITSIPNTTDGNVFHMPMAQVRAQIFLAHGLIYPAACDKPTSTPISDAQALAPDSLVLWRHEPPVSRDEVIFKLLLTPEEVADIERREDPFLWPTPLPISRLLTIAVPAETNEEVVKYVRGWIEPDVPVPSLLFSKAATIARQSATIRVQLPTATPPTQDSTAEAKATITRYNRILGMFAYMRNAARYHSARLGLYADCPAQYFLLAARLNPALDVTSVPKVSPSQLLDSLLDDAPLQLPHLETLRQLAVSSAVYIEKREAQPAAKAIQDAASNKADLERAFRHLFADDYKEAMALLQKEPQHEPAILLAAIYKFSDRQSNDHRTLKPTLHEDWTNIPTVANALALLGYYYGYTALDARETRLYSVDRRLSASIDQRPPIKFHLESAFERQLIEAVYQRTFFHRPLDFSTLGIYSPSVPVEQPRPDPLYWKDESYRVADFTVKSYRLTPLPRLIQRIADLPGSVVDETTFLGQNLMSSCFFHADEYEISRKNGCSILRYSIRKQRLVELISENKIRINVRLLLAALDEDAAGKK